MITQQKVSESLHFLTSFAKKKKKKIIAEEWQTTKPHPDTASYTVTLFPERETHASVVGHLSIKYSPGGPYSAPYPLTSRGE